MDNINHSTNICQQKSIFEIPVIFWVIILFFCFYFSISFFKKKAEKNKHECKSTQTDFIVFPSLSFNFDNPQMKINPPKTSCINFYTYTSTSCMTHNNLLFNNKIYTSSIYCCSKNCKYINV